MDRLEKSDFAVLIVGLSENCVLNPLVKTNDSKTLVTIKLLELANSVTNQFLQISVDVGFARVGRVSSVFSVGYLPSLRKLLKIAVSGRVTMWLKSLRTQVRLPSGFVAFQCLTSLIAKGLIGPCLSSRALLR